MHLVDQACVLVHAQFAHHHVGRGAQLPRRESIGQQQIHRAGQAIDPLRTARLGHRNAQLLPRVHKALHGARPRPVVDHKVSVGILRQPLGAARHAEDRLDTRVIRAHIRQADRPIVPIAVVRLALELVIAQPERLPRPEERPSSEHPYPHPVVGLLRLVGVGNFLLVHPGIGVELVGLKDMGQLARLLEAAKGKLRGWARLRVLVRVQHWPRVEHLYSVQVHRDRLMGRIVQWGKGNLPHFKGAAVIADEKPNKPIQVRLLADENTSIAFRGLAVSESPRSAGDSCMASKPALEAKATL